MNTRIIPEEWEETNPAYKMFFYNYGYLMYMYQLLELWVGDVLVGMKIREYFEKGSEITDKQIDQLYIKNRKSTFGPLVKEFIRNVDNHYIKYLDYSDSLRDRLENRNNMSHHFVFRFLGEMNDEISVIALGNRMLKEALEVKKLLECYSDLNDEIAESLGLGKQLRGIEALDKVKEKEKYTEYIINEAIKRINRK